MSLDNKKETSHCARLFSIILLCCFFYFIGTILKLSTHK